MIVQVKSKRVIAQNCNDPFFGMRNYFFLWDAPGFAGFDLDNPAFDMAIATACRCGRPAAISVLMLDEITFWLLPDLSGISNSG